PWLGLAGSLLAAAVWLAPRGAAAVVCVTDIDCPEPACGGQVCWMGRMCRPATGLRGAGDRAPGLFAVAPPHARHGADAPRAAGRGMLARSERQGKMPRSA